MKSVQILTVFALVLASNAVRAEETAIDEAASLRYDEYVLEVGRCEAHYKRMFQRTPDNVTLTVKTCFIPNWLGKETNAKPHREVDIENFWFWDTEIDCEETRQNLLLEKVEVDPCVEAMKATQTPG